jgi:hypothetical protein
MTDTTTSQNIDLYSWDTLYMEKSPLLSLSLGVSAEFRGEKLNNEGLKIYIYTLRCSQYLLGIIDKPNTIHTERDSCDTC